MDLVKSYTKEYLKEQLKESVARITFIKKNGEKRTMNCTLIESFFPTATTDEIYPDLLGDGLIPPKKIRAESPDTLSVWDIDKSGWRSFIVDSVVNVEYAEDDNPIQYTEIEEPEEEQKEEQENEDTV